MAPRTHDVAIIGGGLVGASLACALAPLGLDVCLLEAVPPRAAAQPSYDDRTLALSAASCRILQGIGLWPALAPRATAIREILVTEQGRFGRVVMRPSELGMAEFGHVVEAREFGRAAQERLEQEPGIDFHCPARVSGIDPGNDEVRVAFQTGNEAGVKTGEIRTRLLVGADGAESPVREALAIPARRYDYRQAAIICNVTPTQPHAGRAFECFTPTGPLALLPHAGERCGLVWSVTADEAPEIMNWDDGRFLAEAQRRFGDALGKWRQVGRRSSYPLRLVCAEHDTARRSIILGNAAHTIHPIGAQGFNLGLRDVAALAELLADSLERSRRDGLNFDAGQPGLLADYSDWRARDRSGTVAYTDGLARLFANPTSAATLARQVGLAAHALIPPLRRRLAIRAMGYGGRVPRLAQGRGLVRESGDAMGAGQNAQ